MSAPTLGSAREALLGLGPQALRELLLGGLPLRAEDLAGWVYHGTSLGLPAWVDRLAWKHFAKAFQADAAGVRGWNVRLRQGLPPGQLEPLRAPGGAPRCFGPFQVEPLPPAPPLPWALPEGVLLDYGPAARALDPLGRLRDPLVALDPEATRVLGCSLLALGRRWRATPSYFLLERAAPLGQLFPA